MVVDYIEDDFDTGFVQSLDRCLELGDRTARQKARIRREEPDRVVAPVIRQPAAYEVTVTGRGMHRQKLDRRDAELDKIIDDCRRGERGKGAALVHIDRRMLDREAAHMHFEDDRLFPGRVRLAVIVPGKGGLDDPAFRHVTGAVAAVEGEIFARASNPITVDDVAPPHLPRNRFRIGIEQQFVRVEAVPGGGIVRAVDAITVELVRPHFRQIAVPYLVGIFGKFDARLLELTRAVEQAQLDLFGMGREQREIDPLAVPARTERVRLSGPDLCRRHQDASTARLRTMGWMTRNPSPSDRWGARWVSLRSTHPAAPVIVTARA